MRKVTLFIIVSLWLLLPGAYAQKASKKNLVNYEELGLQSISKQSVEAQLSFLASDALQGRQTGKQGGLAAGEYIQALLKEWGVKPYYNSYFQPFEAYSPAREKGVEFEVRPDSIAKYKQERAYRRLNLRNVIGIIEGQRTDEFVVVGAHYDHLGVDELLVGDQIYNGADDNASGVVAVLQLAKAFAVSGEKPLRSIIFAFFDGEEINYLGSEYFIANFQQPQAIKSYINIDMIGREGLLPEMYPKFKIPEATIENTATGKQFHLAYTEELSTKGEQASQDITKHHLDIIVKPSVIAHKSRGTDALSFSLRTIPVAWFFTGLHPDYHTPIDEVSTLDLDKVTDITQSAYLFLRSLAN